MTPLKILREAELLGCKEICYDDNGTAADFIIKIAKPGGHFLFGTTIMPMQIPEANIQTMFDAAFEYGSYP